MSYDGIIAILSIFIGLPSIIFGFIYLNRKEKNRISILEYQRQISELELKREEAKIRLIEEENRKYDRIIESNAENKE